MEERLTELLKKAIEVNASDIHFSLDDKGRVKIEMRVNGRITELETRPDDGKLIPYLRYSANLDVANQIRPATGQFELEVDNNTLSLRFAYMKSFRTVIGVLRILNHKLGLKLESLSGFSSQNEYFMNLIQSGYGLVLISGATGSGKTTSLYTMLDAIGDRKIYTIEDPIEIYSENYVQLQVNESIGLGYEACLKQLLRHDPDVIVIGEIRDGTTAATAIKAAASGHLVLATVHASSALLTIIRMQEFGIQEFLLKDMLISIVNQDLYEFSNRKVPIYEIMDSRVLGYYFDNRSLPRYFHKKSYYFTKAVQAGDIEVSEQ